VKKKPVIGGRMLDGNVEIEALADSPLAAVGGAR
jgi:hypothetical protein